MILTGISGLLFSEASAAFVDYARERLSRQLAATYLRRAVQHGGLGVEQVAWR